MKKMTLCFLLVCFSCLLAAQSVPLDSTFGVNGVVETDLYNPTGGPYGIDMVTLSQDKVVICGKVVPPGNYNMVGIRKYDRYGNQDTSFYTEIIESGSGDIGISVQKDEKILFIGVDSINNSYVVRLDTLGNLDPSFGTNGIASTLNKHWGFKNIFELADEKIIVFGGKYQLVDKTSTVMRLLSNGQIDSSFAQGGEFILDIPVNGIELPCVGIEQPDKKLLFAGLTENQNRWNALIFRLTPDGLLDSTFGINGVVTDAFNQSSEFYGLALQSDGKIITTGYTTLPYQAIVVRYHSNGTRDTDFGNHGVHYLPESNECIGVAIRPGGKILTANWHDVSNQLMLAQLLPNGQRDSSFGNNGIFQLYQPRLRIRTLALLGNRAVISAIKGSLDNDKILLRFLLDLNVGTINPTISSDPSLWIYPNPVSEQFHLQFTLTQKAAVSIQLFDLQGKLVQSLQENQVFDSGEHKLSLNCPEPLPPGNYVLTLEVAGEKRSSVQVFKH